MTASHLPEFAMSTGKVLDALQALRKSSTVDEAAKFWSKILEMFFPVTQGFETTTFYSTSDRVMLTLRRVVDTDGDTIFDDGEITAILVVDCRTPPESEAQSQEASPEKNEALDGGNDDSDRDRRKPTETTETEPYEERLVSEFGVISKGLQADLVRDIEVSCTSASQLSIIQLLQGSEMGSVNLAKASGRDKTEQWLRAMAN
ncbi:uncharacterized protein TRUGW13939_05849 [Talaromyces rugulosus]|uniref:Uncharacterized protein n=1 Tax=Talaromyces rugulosus TaxID=121627 RepID=A0A7H8QX84_TALRU|nr:uncharacterized protein TRUGW13939_05849 [Talaromyces rugulosus]QKX58722.1 hypothetical protein TRUGW13939_05849 [Talaromyces rugulosus]